ncbi:uncharacterized protein [Asterias amurensis]|uniref:uncharacterized protein n=1 Tax=Asterias amurensis TaxID=7602 RepID=UPI003AB4D1ED
MMGSTPSSTKNQQLKKKAGEANGTMNNNNEKGSVDLSSQKAAGDGDADLAEKKEEGEEAPDEETIEDKMNKIAEVVTYLKTVDDFAAEECFKKFATLGKLSFDRANRLQLGKYLVEQGFGELYLTIHTNLYTHDLFNKESEDPQRKQALINLKKMRMSYWNYTDSVEELCVVLGRTGALEASIQELSNPALNFDQLKNESRRHVVRGVLGILSNSIRLCGDNREIYRKAGAVEILCTLMKCTFLIVRVQCLLILSYIITEEESEKITATDGSIDFLLTLVKEALKTKEHKTKRYGFTVEELMIGINNLALNDENKVKIVQKGGLDPLVKMLTVHFSDTEQELAAGLVWKLAFVPSNRAVIKHNTPLFEALTELRTCHNAALREACTGALWETTEGKIDLPGHIHSEGGSSHEGATVSNKHIMISYQWDVQKRMIMLKDELISAGYNVWMDVDKMEGDILGAMAEAVENSAVVLVALSRKYKDSHNTRTEATYAYKQNIPIVPLLVEKDYSADGWLGALVGTLLYFKFFEDAQLEQNLPYLVQELGNRAKEGAIVEKGIVQATKASLTASKPAASNPTKVGRAVVATWEKDQVQKWLKDNELMDAHKKMLQFNGELLVQMYKQSQRAPEFFHSSLRQELGLDFLTILKLTSALDKLMI